MKSQMTYAEATELLTDEIDAIESRDGDPDYLDFLYDAISGNLTAWREWCDGRGIEIVRRQS